METRLEAQTGLIDEFGVDLTKPLFPQIDALGDDYDAWVHKGISVPLGAAEFYAGRWRVG